MSKAKNIYRGKKSKAFGQFFEDIIEVSCREYERQGIASITKTPEPLKNIRDLRNGQHIAVFTKQAQPDFTGVIKGGRSILMEVKNTSSGRIEFSRINDTQTHYLNTHGKLGALCLVVISFSLKEFYTVPWEDWLELKESIGKKSVNQKDLEPYKTDFNNRVVRFLDRFV